MSIDRAEVARIAELARLEIAPDRIDKMVAELSSVLDFVAALNRLDLSGCEPMVFAPAAAPLRDDATDERLLPVDRALAAAPAGEHDFFLVPPIVENVNP